MRHTLIFRQLLILVFILLAGCFTRLSDLHLESMWADEIMSYNRASLTDWDTAHEMLKKANHPPLYEWIFLRLWSSFGTQDLVMRLSGVLLGVLSIGLTFALGKILFSVRIGQVGALLFALSPLHVYYSRELRMYALLTVLTTLAILALYRAIRRGGWRYWLGYSILGAANIYTHYYASFTLLALNSIVLVHLISSKERRPFVYWVVANLGVIALFAPWLPTFWLQLHSDPVQWIPPTTGTVALQLLTHFFAKEQLLSQPIWWLITGAVWGTVALGVTTYPQAPEKSRARFGYPFLAGTVGLILGIALLASLFKPLIHPRFFSSIAPAVSVLLAYGLVRYQPRLPAWLLAMILLAASLFSSYAAVTYHWKEDWKGVAAYVKANSEPDDRILIFAPSEYWTAPFEHYYDGKLQITVSEGDLSSSPDLSRALEALPAGGRIWLIQSARHADSRSLDYELSSEHSKFLELREKFDQDLLMTHLAVDLWLLDIKSPSTNFVCKKDHDTIGD